MPYVQWQSSLLRATGLGRMLMTLAEMQGVPIAVFRNPADAETWLGTVSQEVGRPPDRVTENC